VHNRPYAREMLRVFNNLATRVDTSAHPLLNTDPTQGRTLLVVITADRGLCGGFNTNVIKGASQFIAEQGPEQAGQRRGARRWSAARGAISSAAAGSRSSTRR